MTRVWAYAACLWPKPCWPACWLTISCATEGR